MCHRKLSAPARTACSRPQLAQHARIRSCGGRPLHRRSSYPKAAASIARNLRPRAPRAAHEPACSRAPRPCRMRCNPAPSGRCLGSCFRGHSPGSADRRVGAYARLPPKPLPLTPCFLRSPAPRRAARLRCTAYWLGQLTATPTIFPGAGYRRRPGTTSRTEAIAVSGRRDAYRKRTSFCRRSRLTLRRPDRSCNVASRHLVSTA